MNNLTTFTHPELGSMRAVNSGDMPWFVGKEVATNLGYSNPTKAIINHVDDEDKQFVMLDFGEAESQNGIVPSGKSKTTLINESGLYSLILRSKLPSAQRFKRWVTSEVLPALRRNGTYSMTNVDTNKALMEAVSIIKAQNKLIMESNNQMGMLKAQYAKLTDSMADINIRLDALGNMGNRQIDLLSALVSHDSAPEAVAEVSVTTNTNIPEFAAEPLGVRASARELGMKQREFVTWMISHGVFTRNRYGNLCLTDRYADCEKSFQVSHFKRWYMEEPAISVKITASGRRVIWNAIQSERSAA